MSNKLPEIKSDSIDLEDYASKLYLKLETDWIFLSNREKIKIIHDTLALAYQSGKVDGLEQAKKLNQTIRERAEFLAHEIFGDRLALEEETADAIEVEIRRFAK